MKPKTLYRKPIRPTREVKHRFSNPTTDFALAGDMITKQEYDEALKGNVTVSPKLIMNLNAPLPNFPTGTAQELYVGRGSIVTARNFLEL